MNGQSFQQIATLPFRKVFAGIAAGIAYRDYIRSVEETVSLGEQASRLMHAYGLSMDHAVTAVVDTVPYSSSRPGLQGTIDDALESCIPAYYMGVGRKLRDTRFYQSSHKPARIN